MTELGNHLWQSTAVAAAVAGVCLLLRNHSPRLRYWLLLCASLKFLLPFSLLVAVGSEVEAPVAAPMLTAVAVEQVSAAFAPAPPSLPRPSRAPAATPWPAAIGLTWAAGFVGLLAWRARQWQALHAVRRKAVAASIPFPIPVLSAPSLLEPGVFGIFRPALLLPEGIRDKLPRDQFLAILEHERCHVRYRDNLTAALQMAVEALFWFHPLVWWLGARLVDERERHCDECVVSQGSEPDAYAQGILNVCRHYLASPLPCAAGVTGSDLKRRIREIMTHRRSVPLGAFGKAGLALAALAVLSLPLVIGRLRAQTLPPPPQYTYEVVAIRPSQPGETRSRLGPGPQGGVRALNNTAMQLLTFAYDVREFQFADAPGWVTSSRFDVTLTPDKPEPSPGPGMPLDQAKAIFSRHSQRMQAVLRDRFGLVLRVQTRDLPYYSLTVAKSGVKLRSPENKVPGTHLSTTRGELTGRAVDMSMLVRALSSLVGRHVKDETGLAGSYDFQMKWAGDDAGGSADPNAASIFTAITEQLGLKLESARGPVPVYVIEKISKPSDN